MSTTPITRRNARASILIVGWLETKRPIAPANAIMSSTEPTTAAIITSSRSTMPTAVMIESSENTRSMIAICKITAENVVPRDRDASSSPPISS